MSTELRLERRGYDPFPQRDLGLQLSCMSRPLIEATLRKKMAVHRNISVRQSSKAQELLVNSKSSAVTGVRFDHKDGKMEDIAADFLVDASSHGLLTLNLLALLGLPAPKEDTIGVPEDASTDWKGMMILPDPSENRRGAFVLPCEAHRWIVTLAGRYSDKPPDDEAGYFSYVKNLRTPTAQNALRNAKRQSGFSRYILKASRRRYFEGIPTFPDGLLPFGDAICRFNPVYGQGMSVAAKEACLLQSLLWRVVTKKKGSTAWLPHFWPKLRM